MIKEVNKKMKLSSIRLVWGITGGLLFLTSFLQFIKGEYPLATIQIISSLIPMWFSIKPPAGIRKNFAE